MLPRTTRGRSGTTTSDRPRSPTPIAAAANTQRSSPTLNGSPHLATALRPPPTLSRVASAASHHSLVAPAPPAEPAPASTSIPIPAPAPWIAAAPPANPTAVATAFADSGAGRIRFVDQRADHLHLASRGRTHSFSAHAAAMSRKVTGLVGGIINEDAGESSQRTNASAGSAGAPLFQRPASTISSSNSSTFYYPTPDQGVTREEVWRMLANRIMFSKFYKAFYVTMTVLALITIYLSLTQTCPTTAFLALECIVNLSLIVEVTIRFLATRRQFFQSRANVLDVVLVALCLFLLGMMLHDAQSCSSSHRESGSQRSEAVVDSVLLILRNLLQLTRIVNMLRKNQSQLANRVASVDFTNLEEGYQDPLLFDAEDEQHGFGVSVTSPTTLFGAPAAPGVAPAPPANFNSTAYPR
ncbi:hypothetical protein H9P43_007331 [Blastocladiella emersonii ATCC 22665]|nr:hypothetical protein H9P43_007331 [Blastocladiella emersonii ATCC 22665]